MVARLVRYHALMLFLGLLALLPLYAAEGAIASTESAGLNDCSHHPDGSEFGSSVSVDGNTAVVGAPGDQLRIGANPDDWLTHGSACVFVRDTSGAWSEEKWLVPDQGGNKRFGSSVSVDGNTVVVGAPMDNDGDGAVYVFTRSGTTWTEPQHLTGGSESGDSFGGSVSVDGDTMAVTGINSSVFGRNAGVWSEQAELPAGSESVSVNGDTVVVGGSGSVYVLTRTETGWSQPFHLPVTGVAADDRFGYSVSVDGNTVVVGAPWDDDKGAESGAVYVFTRSGTTWSQQQKLTASNGHVNGQFGVSVSVDGDIAGVVGSDGLAGSAYVFTRSGTTWSELPNFNTVGGSVSVDGDTVVVGDPFHSVCDAGGCYPTIFGRAYVYLLQPANQPPTANAGGPYSVPEGGSVLLNGTGSDPEGGTMTYAWDLDHDEAFETVGQSVSFPAAANSAPSSHTVTLRVTDDGGLTAEDEATVNVIYNFSGFFQPVDNLPTLNSVNAGRAIPVKFSLGGDQGLNIFEAGYPKSQVITCDSSLVDGIEETSTDSSSSLSYDASPDTYTYVWKTDKLWGGTCRQLVVRLNDGTSHLANFKFNK